MSGVLDKIDGPADVKGLTLEEMTALAAEIRVLMIQTISKTGGHLASNLGMVELTLALLKVFQPPADKILMDVSHQAYAYKILTGRKNQFPTLRQYQGLSGFMSRKESACDAFGAGHAGTALSAALGMAVARDRKRETHHVVAVVGDAALGGGSSFEALNNIQGTTERLIVVLNDNEMSISENVGAVSRYLGEMLTNPSYNKWKHSIEGVVKRMSGQSNALRRLYYQAEESVKSMFLHSVLFEEFGLRYIGPIDGHDLTRLVAALEIARDDVRPILLHVVTQKGRGYSFAEKCPENWHGIGTFNVETGLPGTCSSAPSYSQVFGNTLERLAASDPAIVAITAAMRTGTGLATFATRYPDRFFDVGICEEHAVIFAAGLAAQGMTPVLPLYSTFSQRVVDYILHDVCLQNLPVVICLDRAGIVGDDGPTHHGIYDLAMMRTFPGLTIMQPADGVELAHMLYSAIKWKRPVVIRYPRGICPGYVAPEQLEEVVPGKACIVREGWEIHIWALGDMIPVAMAAADHLATKGFSVGVVNARFVVPLDQELILAQSKRAQAFVTIENGVAEGGFGSAVTEVLGDLGYQGRIIRNGWPREFVPHGAPAILMEKFGMTAVAIAERVAKTVSIQDSVVRNQNSVVRMEA